MCSTFGPTQQRHELSCKWGGCGIATFSRAVQSSAYCRAHSALRRRRCRYARLVDTIQRTAGDMVTTQNLQDMNLSGVVSVHWNDVPPKALPYPAFSIRLLTNVAEWCVNA